MRATPEELAATTARKVFIQPAIRLRWNSLPDRLFVLSNQVTTASHAPRLARFQAKLSEHEIQLLPDFQRRWQPKRCNDPVAQEPPLHQHAVGSQDCRRLLARFTQLIIINVGAPKGVMTRRSQPAC